MRLTLTMAAELCSVPDHKLDCELYNTELVGLSPDARLSAGLMQLLMLMLVAAMGTVASVRTKARPGRRELLLLISAHRRRELSLLFRAHEGQAWEESTLTARQCARRRGLVGESFSLPISVHGRRELSVRVKDRPGRRELLLLISAHEVNAHRRREISLLISAHEGQAWEEKALTAHQCARRPGLGGGALISAHEGQAWKKRALTARQCVRRPGLGGMRCHCSSVRTGGESFSLLISVHGRRELSLLLSAHKGQAWEESALAARQCARRPGLGGERSRCSSVRMKPRPGRRELSLLVSAHEGQAWEESALTDRQCAQEERASHCSSVCMGGESSHCSSVHTNDRSGRRELHCSSVRTKARPGRRVLSLLVSAHEGQTWEERALTARQCARSPGRVRTKARPVRKELLIARQCARKPGLGGESSHCPSVRTKTRPGRRELSLLVRAHEDQAWEERALTTYLCARRLGLGGESPHYPSVRTKARPGRRELLTAHQCAREERARCSSVCTNDRPGRRELSLLVSAHGMREFSLLVRAHEDQAWEKRALTTHLCAQTPDLVGESFSLLISAHGRRELSLLVSAHEAQA
ncbi:hypothetical protein NDU88_008443 [Pleurodeles waltl]|uniref:Uncharacterized protein n=1 Tax=Pleurodeles waltl TaxID=8319 RepID=A0AAV7N514_PLEWA|nr:hypothetical protein NDU88_008443 [Pleurodeles waltl]